MKKRYIVFLVIVLIILFFVFFGEDEVKSEKVEKNNNTISKEEFKYSTKEHDNINELVKDTVIEEVKINYVCEKNGLVLVDDNYYYFVNGEIIKNQFKDNKYFKEDGIMVIGFYDIDGKTYYFNNDGYVIGKQVIDNINYYFDENGVMLKDIEKDKIYYGLDGKQVIGEYEKDGYIYYYGEEGKEKDKFIDNKYYDLNGKYIPNLIKENNNIYCYENNEIVKGLKLINGIRYYFDFDNGSLVEKNVKSVIDISTWQDDIDFDSVKNSGLVDGVIVRLGFGSLNGEDCTVDNRFERNISELKRLEIPYGIYFYGYAQNEEASVVEANFVSDMINNYELKLSYPIFYDAELTEFHGVKYTKKLYKKVISSFISLLNNNGFNNVGVYGNLNMFLKGSLSSLDENIPKWVAQYYTRCEYDKDYVGWQYSSSGNIPGINTKVDLNIFY